MNAWVEKAKKWLNHRAYCYRVVFTGQASDVVLRDLAKFCRANESTAHTDPHVAARLDGRREVWLRLQSHLKLTDEQLWELFGGNKPQ